MLTILIEMETDNDAFQFGNTDCEIKRVINEGIKKLYTEGVTQRKTTLKLRDVNGNVVGKLTASYE